MSWYLQVLKKYAVFSGRARRKEYWYFTLISFIILIVLALIDAAIGTVAVLYGLYYLGVILPSLAVLVRRLHDIGRSGWWVLIGLVPAIGGIILLIFTLIDSQPETNQYGPSPKAA